ncbi:MAG: hypothetical protein QM668_21085 [Agriterribacter sp.]
MPFVPEITYEKNEKNIPYFFIISIFLFINQINNNMKRVSFLLLLTIVTTTTYAQFWKKAINVVANPVGWATGEAAKKITGNQNIVNLINPTPVIIDNTIESVNKTKSLVQDAIRQGDWYSLNIYASPWFVQTLSAAKSAKQLGLLKENECYQMARDIAVGLAAKAGVETGSPTAAAAINQYVNEFGNNVCGNTFEGNSNINPQQVSQATINTDGTVSLNGQAYDFNQVYNYQNRQVISCTDDINHIVNIVGFADGKFYTPGYNGQYTYFANLLKDPTGKFLFVFRRFDSPVWYGIDWQGIVWGPNQLGQTIRWGQCSCNQ